MPRNSQPFIFDCDIHQTFQDQSALYPYLSEKTKKRVMESRLGYPSATYHSPAGYRRLDSIPPNGVAGSDKPFLKSQLFQEMGISAGILNGSGIIGVSNMPEMEYPHELAKAYNNWMISEWLDKDDCFYGSLHIALQNVEESAAMIRDLGSHSKIVQVILPAGTAMPISHKNYAPILQACNDMELAIALHIWQPSVMNNVCTPIGNPNLYAEWRTLAGMPHMAQLVNVIYNGVFVTYPKLKIMFLEAGYTWLIYFLNRMEQMYKSLRAEMPWLEHPPIHYVKKHCRFSTQPLEELNISSSPELFEAFCADELL